MQAQGLGSGRVARQRGAAFIVALALVVIMVAVALVFARQMRTEAQAAGHHTAQVAARWVAWGALSAVRGDLLEAMREGQQPRLRQVGDRAEPMGGGLYWLIRPDYATSLSSDQPRPLTYGLAGEAGKLNVNTHGVEALIELPGVSDAIAAALVDWRDPDDEITPGGAESSHYLSSHPAYRASNSPFVSLGEMRLVRGVDDTLLYGTPQQRGLLDFVTVFSTEPAMDAAGNTMIAVNQASATPALLAFLQESLGEERGNALAVTMAGQRPFANALDLLIRARITEAEWRQIHARLWVGPAGGGGGGGQAGPTARSGLVDVYSAPAEVLDALPGMDPGDGARLVAARPRFSADEGPPPLDWIVTVLGDEKARAIGGQLTYRSLQWTADIVAVSPDGQAFCRWRVVLGAIPGTEGGSVRVLDLQDLTRWGWPLAPEILVALRRGVRPETLSESLQRSDSLDPLWMDPL